jgi:hypothetical protein
MNAFFFTISLIVKLFIFPVPFVSFACKQYKDMIWISIWRWIFDEVFFQLQRDRFFILSHFYLKYFLIPYIYPFIFIYYNIRDVLRHNLTAPSNHANVLPPPLPCGSSSASLYFYIYKYTIKLFFEIFSWLFPILFYFFYSSKGITIDQEEQMRTRYG